MTGQLRMTASFLSTVFCLVGAALAAPPASGKAAAPDTPIEELQTMFDRGDCDAVLDKIEKSRSSRPPAVEVVVFEANCRLQKARHTEKKFDTTAYERFRIAEGGVWAKRGDTGTFFKTIVTYDPAGRTQALKLFREALQRAPTRPDLVVGNVAAMAQVGDVDEAAALLQSRKDVLDPASRDDVGRVVEDLLGAREKDRANTLARALAQVFPDSPTARRALASCAIDRQDFAAAISQFTALLSQEPANVDLARRLCPLLLYSRRWQQVATLASSFADQNDDFLFWFGLARLRLAPGSAAALFDELARRVNKSPKPDARLKTLAEHYRTVDADPRRPTVAMRLRAANRFADEDFPLPAVVELDDALAQAPRSVEAWKRLADLYRRRGLYTLALDALDRALAIVKEAPAADVAYNASELDADRGRALFGLERYREAAETFGRARANGTPVLYEEGLSTVLAGNTSAGVALLEQAAAGEGEPAALAKAKLEALRAKPPQSP